MSLRPASERERKSRLCEVLRSGLERRCAEASDTDVGWLLPIDPGSLAALQPIPAPPRTMVEPSFWTTRERNDGYIPSFRGVLPTEYRTTDEAGNTLVYERIEGGGEALRRVELNATAPRSVGGVLQYAGRGGAEYVTEWTSPDGVEGILFAGTSPGEELILDAVMRLSTLCVIRDTLPVGQLQIDEGTTEAYLMKAFGSTDVAQYAARSDKEEQAAAIVDKAAAYRSRVEQAIYTKWQSEDTSGVTGVAKRAKYRGMLVEVMSKTLLQYNASERDVGKAFMLKPPKDVHGLDLESEPALSPLTWQLFRKRTGTLAGIMDWTDSSISADIVDEYNRVYNAAGAYVDENPWTAGAYLLGGIIALIASAGTIGLAVALRKRQNAQKARDAARRQQAQARDAARAVAGQQRIALEQQQDADLIQAIRDKRAALDVVRFRILTLQAIAADPQTKARAEREEQQKRYEEQQLTGRIQALMAQAVQRGLTVPP